ncbi:MAG: 2-C-methyl-D-erythritol 2,4-cyclodiphosphate synthase [Clostridia bacterium]|nr:2-C-methyl-D-erythritol 2,4-cyclodiphosphate synthase [Clostridia bacterium]
MRIGHGYDVHKLTEGRDLILCGEKIPFEKGLLGHSDADVALHALTDAMLGALALGDIGSHFPDTDPKYKGIDSMLLLKNAYELIKKQGFVLGNADITIIAQRPKLKDFIPAMQKNIAHALQADISQISVKATTEEKLGFTGSGEGISAHCVCLLKKER